MYLCMHRKKPNWGHAVIVWQTNEWVVSCENENSSVAGKSE